MSIDQEFSEFVLSETERRYWIIHEDNSYVTADDPKLTFMYADGRALLEALNGIGPENRTAETDALTIRQLVELFNDANGDGQNWQTVFVEVEPYTYRCVLG